MTVAWIVVPLVALAQGVPGPDASGVHAPVPAPGPTPAPAAPASAKSKWYWLTRWFDPSTAPFIPVPEIATDPDSGTTLGILPTVLLTNDKNEINRIIAPDLLHNPNFGFGFHARMYDYVSPDEQWSVIGGAKQRVEREFELEYEIGRSRQGRWSFTGSLAYDRDGTPRFYGIGNRTHEQDQTNYTAEQDFVQGQLGYNFNSNWQLLYTARLRVIDVLPGTISGVPSIETRFGRAQLGTHHEILNRLSLIFDNLDDLTIPSQGVKLVAYGGVASNSGLFNETAYSEAGVDGRAFIPIAPGTIIATHLALRYLPLAHNVPFWALSSIGGGESGVGGPQPLRGYGGGRFTDRNSFSYSVEVRHKIFDFNAISTHVEIEMAPFVDLGRVFRETGSLPFNHLHTVGGVGFRGIARPYVVGYVDIGYGSEGSAVFTGINYPF